MSENSVPFEVKADLAELERLLLGTQPKPAPVPVPVRIPRDPRLRR